MTNIRKSQAQGLRLQVVPDRLKRHRLEKSWTQLELALEAGVDDSLISYLERGERNATPVTIKRLARALSCDPLDIAEVTDVGRAS
ncbi:MAG: helix-turn-helix domain-containing protein [Actinomycetota bacterium]